MPSGCCLTVTSACIAFPPTAAGHIDNNFSSEQLLEWQHGLRSSASTVPPSQCSRGRQAICVPSSTFSSRQSTQAQSMEPLERRPSKRLALAFAPRTPPRRLPSTRATASSRPASAQPCSFHLACSCPAPRGLMRGGSKVGEGTQGLAQPSPYPNLNPTPNPPLTLALTLLITRT